MNLTKLCSTLICSALAACGGSGSDRIDDASDTQSDGLLDADAADSDASDTDTADSDVADFDTPDTPDGDDSDSADSGDTTDPADVPPIECEPPPPACSTDGDCTDGALCNAGDCVAPIAPQDYAPTGDFYRVVALDIPPLGSDSGFDLNGDGTIDNVLGSLLAGLPGIEDRTEQTIRDMIDRGIFELGVEIEKNPSVCGNLPQSTSADLAIHFVSRDSDRDGRLSAEESSTAARSEILWGSLTDDRGPQCRFANNSVVNGGTWLQSSDALGCEVALPMGDGLLMTLPVEGIQVTVDLESLSNKEGEGTTTFQVGGYVRLQSFADEVNELAQSCGCAGVDTTEAVVETYTDGQRLGARCVQDVSAADAECDDISCANLPELCTGLVLLGLSADIESPAGGGQRDAVSFGFGGTMETTEPRDPPVSPALVAFGDHFETNETLVLGPRTSSAIARVLGNDQFAPTTDSIQSLEAHIPSVVPIEARVVENWIEVQLLEPWTETESTEVSMNYTIGDGASRSSTATLTLRVVRRTPSLDSQDDSFHVRLGTPNSPLDVLANDSSDSTTKVVEDLFAEADPENSATELATEVGRATVVDGVLYYEALTRGTHTFGYRAYAWSESGGESEYTTGTVTVTVDCPVGSFGSDCELSCVDCGTRVCNDGAGGDGTCVCAPGTWEDPTCTAETCVDGCRAEVCGDGRVQPGRGEACDLGAENSDSAPDVCRTNCQLPTCGDGVVDSDDECDDGNTVANDGCASDCDREFCGDGQTQAVLGEQCDTFGESAPSCDADCTLPECGDGILNTAADELCDSEGINADECDSDCTLPECGDALVNAAAGELCDAGAANSDTAPDTCRTTCQPPACGDGVMDAGEACDDGNTADGDECPSTCVSAGCGDYLVDGAEECDDGPDGSATCDGNCTFAVCGDFLINTAADEVCDDGNSSSGDGCSDSCQREFCGDFYVSEALGESCDEGGDETGACDPDCTLAACGDQYVNGTAGEACDNGNSNSNSLPNACRTDCQPARCGDGVLDSGEQCEAGDVDCDADCQIIACETGPRGIYYADLDGDDYGDTTTAERRCPGDGWVALDGDCNDGDVDINPGVVEFCGDDIDADCDATPDCEEAECRYQTWCFESSCYDEFDDDFDGQLDCADPDCREMNSFLCLEFACDDGIDDNLNGLFDCEDPDCRGSDSCREASCNDGFDDNFDGRTDCRDFSCQGVPPCTEVHELECGNGLDDDADDMQDCMDPDCRWDFNCFEYCDDGLDNNYDGLTDCEALGCGEASNCTEFDCVDGIDNDGDGSSDCEDANCAGYSTCRELECDDGFDGDSDGLADCADFDCTYSCF